jgi:hypothetical protein
MKCSNESSIDGLNFFYPPFKQKINSLLLSQRKSVEYFKYLGEFNYIFVNLGCGSGNLGGSFDRIPEIKNFLQVYTFKDLVLG